MGEVRAPAAADVQVLPVQFEVRVEGDFAVVRVLPYDADAARVARVAHRLHDGDWRSRGLDGHVSPAPFGLFEHPLPARLLVTRLEVEDCGRAQLPRRFEPALRRAYA